MGNSSTKLNQAVIQQIKEETNFTENEARDLYRLFREMAQQGGHSAHRLNSDNILQIFARAFPGTDCQPFATLVYDYYDKDCSGDIDFREFLMGLNDQLKPGLNSKMVYAFSLMDKKHKGTISHGNIVDVISSLYKLQRGYLPLEEVVEPRRYADRIFAVAQLPSDARLDFVAFKRVVSSSKTAASLVESISEAACQPYMDRQQQTGSIGRKRASTVVEQDKSEQRPRSRSQRGFTV